MNKLCIDVFSGFTYDRLLPMVREVGFDGFFSGEEQAASFEKLKNLRNMSELLQLEYETSHATIPGCQTIWSADENNLEYIDILKNNIDNCHRLSIPIIVIHVQLDFKGNNSFDAGIKRLEEVVGYARNKGVKIAFENINSPEYLFMTLEHFNTKDVGFCYDCGHEACHTSGIRFLPEIGNRLMCTHIHDNDCKSDLHLIPFDGNIDFVQICNELKECNYKGNITLELSYSEKYKNELTEREFLIKCYKSAEKIKNMIW